MIITFNDDLTTNVTTDDGLLECILSSTNPETQHPFSSREEVQAFAEGIGANPNYFSRKRSDEEKEQALREAGTTVARTQRDALLSLQVDTMSPMRWNTLTPAEQALWSQYRIDLLNVPSQIGFPLAIEWPTHP